MRIYPRPKKRLGQVFLTNSRIAEAEAVHGEGKIVAELGPGHGILTRELCKTAKSVVAIEKDRDLYNLLLLGKASDRLKLINADFFKMKKSFVKDFGIEIMISNIPYNLSSRVIEWLMENNLQAVLCLQKEFVEHMLAIPGSSNYSRLSVMSSLLLRVTKIMDVRRGSFSPVPRVDSAVVYIKPLKTEISREESMTINLLMQHKKKKLRNAIIDSNSSMGITKEKASGIAERLGSRETRVFKMPPEEILNASREIAELLKAQKE